MTKKELLLYPITRKIKRISCVIPEQSIDYFLVDDSDFRFMYGVSPGQIYQYDLTEQCKPVKSFHIPKNGNIQLTSHSIFIETGTNQYALNLTDRSLQSVSLPLAACSGTKKQSILKKISHEYIVSSICLN